MLEKFLQIICFIFIFHTIKILKFGYLFINTAITIEIQTEGYDASLNIVGTIQSFLEQANYL